MAYAIVEAGGTQIRVEPGRFYDINLLAGEPDSDYTLDKVLLKFFSKELLGNLVRTPRTGRCVFLMSR